MNSIFYSVITLLLLLSGVLFFMKEDGANKPDNASGADPIPPRNKEEGEDHFSALLNAITPLWYWRVNHEYIDFTNATIKKMTFEELNATPGLFEAQRRCSNLNSAVYKYYDNLKKRCLNGELVTFSDIEVLNLRHCFHEFSQEAYPQLVAIVWPEFQRPQVDITQV
ncbi:RNA helicase [Cronobacter sakazakii]|nr:RNA helicase [Cronobacter sakazakii]